MNASLLSDSLQFRTLGQADLDQIMVIERAAYVYPWTEGNFRDCFKSKYECLAAELQGEMVGYIILMMIVDEAHLLNICVDPRHQGKGYGREILLKGIQHIEAKFVVSTMFLEVRPSNKAAIELYQSIGFCEVGLRKNYYPASNGKEDAIIMALPMGD